MIVIIIMCHDINIFILPISIVLIYLFSLTQTFNQFLETDKIFGDTTFVSYGKGG